jgi:hypothetical protein
MLGGAKASSGTRSGLRHQSVSLCTSRSCSSVMMGYCLVARWTRHGLVLSRRRSFLRRVIRKLPSPPDRTGVAGQAAQELRHRLLRQANPDPGSAPVPGNQDDHRQQSRPRSVQNRSTTALSHPYGGKRCSNLPVSEISLWALRDSNPRPQPCEGTVPGLFHLRRRGRNRL